jgi:hypothetical protein
MHGQQNTNNHARYPGCMILLILDRKEKSNTFLSLLGYEAVSLGDFIPVL